MMIESLIAVLLCIIVALLAIMAVPSAGMVLTLLKELLSMRQIRTIEELAAKHAIIYHPATEDEACWFEVPRNKAGEEFMDERLRAAHEAGQLKIKKKEVKGGTYL